MPNWDADDGELATAFYRSIVEPGKRSVLDFLIDHPDRRTDGVAIAESLGFTDHRDVARATYAYGEIARGLSRPRPWLEGQLGYEMPADRADLFKKAREAAGT